MTHFKRHEGTPPDLVGADHEPWWKGARGEWLVVVQVLLIWNDPVKSARW
jgi:hypothetical protein